MGLLKGAVMRDREFEADTYLWNDKKIRTGILKPVVYILIGTAALCFTVTACQAGSSFGAAAEQSATQERVTEHAAGADVKEQIILSHEEITLGTSRQKKIESVVFAGNDAVDSEVQWTSDNATVASVSSDGVITACEEGTANITAVTAGGGAAAVEVTAVPLQSAEVSRLVQAGDVMDLSALGLLPKGTDCAELEWSSSDPDVAEVRDGAITVSSEGTAIIQGAGDTMLFTCRISTGCQGQLIAHRGLSAEAPENTTAAFELAGQAGAWGIETDVYDTADGVLVCIHDESINSMTNGAGKVNQLTYEELESYRIDNGSNIAQYSELTIPTFEAYLNICKKYDAVAVIELKKLSSLTLVGDVYDMLCQCQMENQCMVISFQLEYLQELRRYSETIPVQLIVKNAEKADVDKAAALGNSGIDFSSADAELIAYAHSLNCLTNVWTVDQSEEQQSWRAAGIDFITTNTLGREKK